MQQYHIFHSTSAKAFTEETVQPREYVGYVEAQSLDDAYAKSQNDENPWNYEPCRSTSVGDVIQSDDGFFMVKKTGFQELI